jgi:hypothetical protein
VTDPAFQLRAGEAGAVVEGTPGYVMTFQADGKSVAGEPTAGVAPVLSVFARIGNVVAALNDYAASLIANDSSVAGATVKDALNALLAAIPSVPVSSVFARTGAVVAALNDYAASLVANDSSVAGATVKDALNSLAVKLPGQLCLAASGSWTSLTSGASAIAQLETATNKVNYFVVEFLPAVQSFVEWDFVMPSDWDGSTVVASFYWAATAASLNSVVWGLQGRAYVDGAAIDQAFGVAVEVTDANNGSDVVNVSPATAAMTFAGAPAGGQHVQVRAYRLGSGADSLAATANLLEVRVTYGRV